MLTAMPRVNLCSLFCNPAVSLGHRASLYSQLALIWSGGEPCERVSFDDGNNRLSGLARPGVKISQGLECVDKPVVVAGFPGAGINSQLCHSRGIEARVQLLLEARRLQSSCDLGDLCREK